MRKSFAIVLMCCAFALATSLVACGGSSSSGSASSSEASSSSAASSESLSSASASTSASSAASTVSSASVSASSASSASTSTSSASSTSGSAQGTPQITMGDMGLLNVHETNTGVGADVVIQVKNTGNVPLVMGKPNIKIANESGTVIVDESGNGIFTGPSYLRVGDVGFIYSTGPIPLPAGYFPGYNYLAQGSADLTACKEVHEYPLSNLKISEGSQGEPTVTGTVTNDDTEKANLIEITAVFIDNDNQTLGVAGEVVANLEPGQSKDFTIDGGSLPVGCTMAVISNYDVIAVAPKR